MATVDSSHHEDDAAGAQSHHKDHADRNGKAGDSAEDEFPSINELLAFSSKGNSKGYQNSEKTPQPLASSKLDNGVSNSQGTREKPVILDEDGLDTPEPEAVAISVPVTVGANLPLELSIGPW
ncbi:hypothetical protein BDZ45DRAFT_742296 [Acephala macrosclerotiorum]|nr:hypothetical protein BDZ45DRAFT_742296 [Acephala macrosclerotiorum]